MRHRETGRGDTKRLGDIERLRDPEKQRLEASIERMGDTQSESGYNIDDVMGITH